MSGKITKLPIHAVLIAVSAVFMFPFFWMFSTSLKPREQTTVYPPVWAPKRYHAPIDGETHAVCKDHEVRQPCSIVRCVDEPVAGKKMLVDKESITGGAIGMQTRQGYRRIRVEVLKDVPATQQSPWWYVVERVDDADSGKQRRWDCVPPEAIASTFHPEFSNYLDTVNLNQPKPDPLPSSAGLLTRLKRLVNVPMVLCLRNTLIVCFFSVLGVVLSSAVVAYGFARIRWWGRDTIFFLLLCTMMIPFPVIMVPMFIVFRTLGWVGSLLPLFIPCWFGNVFFIFLLRQFFMTIPHELSDAARIDGCSEFGIFMRVILPLSKPALAVVALFQFLWSWNDFLAPLIYLNDERTFTLALGLQNFESQHGGTEWHLLMAGSTLVVVPVIVLFFFTQKTFIQGIATTGLKA